MRPPVLDKKNWCLKSFTENILLAQHSWTPTCFSYSRCSVRICAMMRGWRLKWRLWGGWEGQVSVGSISLLQCQQFLVRFWIITCQYLWYTLDVLFQIIPFMSDQFQLCLHTIDVKQFHSYWFPDKDWAGYQTVPLIGWYCFAGSQILHSSSAREEQRNKHCGSLFHLTSVIFLYLALFLVPIPFPYGTISQHNGVLQFKKYLPSLPPLESPILPPERKLALAKETSERPEVVSLHVSYIVLQHIPRARLEIITDGLLITSGCLQCIGNGEIQSLISDIASFNIFNNCVILELKCFPDLKRGHVISLFWFSIQLTWKISHHVLVDLLSDLNALVWIIPSLFLKFCLFLQVHQLSSCVPHQHLERR